MIENRKPDVVGDGLSDHGEQISAAVGKNGVEANNRELCKAQHNEQCRSIVAPSLGHKRDSRGEWFVP